MKKKELQTFKTREEISKKKFNPISIPKGNYFTTQRIAEICNIPVKEIKPWIQ